MPKNNVFTLAGAHRDAESRSLLRRLAEQEKAGDIVGLVVVTLCRRGQKKEYFLSTSGWANDNPTLALGAMTSCKALLEGTALRDAGLLK